MERLRLEIVTPQRLLVDEEVDMVEAPGTAGEFGVLPGHVTFLTTLEHGEIRYMVNGKSRILATSGGFSEVVDNKVTMLLDTAEFGEDIDRARAQKAKDRAEAALKGLSNDDTEYHILQAALMRAIIRISTASRSEQ